MKRFPLYERLLKLYPPDYQRQYSSQMLQTLSDMLDDSPSRTGRLLIWFRLAIDVPVSIVKVQSGNVGAAFLHETPKFILGSSLFSILLLLPFFVALFANSLDVLFFHHRLYASWLWHMPILAVWVLWLPLTAFCLDVISFSAYTFMPQGTSRSSVLKRAFDVKHIWPIMVPAVLAFGILFMIIFHDSAHCWLQNPAYFVTRFHQTLECTKTGSSFVS